MSLAAEELHETYCTVSFSSKGARDRGNFTVRLEETSCQVWRRRFGDDLKASKTEIRVKFSCSLLDFSRNGLCRDGSQPRTAYACNDLYSEETVEHDSNMTDSLCQEAH